MEEDAPPGLFAIAMSMARMETKLDTIIAQSSDHETRLRLVEERQSSPLRVYAVPASMLAAISTASMFLFTYMNHH